MLRPTKPVSDLSANEVALHEERPVPRSASARDLDEVAPTRELAPEGTPPPFFQLAVALPTGGGGGAGAGGGGGALPQSFILVHLVSISQILIPVKRNFTKLGDIWSPYR